jgi:hypothetical protein
METVRFINGPLDGQTMLVDAQVGELITVPDIVPARVFGEAGDVVRIHVYSREAGSDEHVAVYRGELTSSVNEPGARSLGDSEENGSANAPPAQQPEYSFPSGITEPA